MSDREALLRAVIDDPADDVPRLALADWWEENGQPERAEFIRLSCALARRPDDDAPDRDAQERRFTLWKALSRALFDELPRLRGVEWRGFGPRSRGFADEIVVTGVKGFLENAGAAFRAAPVDHLSFRKATAADLARVLALPWMRQIVSLNLGGREVGDEGVRAVTEAPDLSALRELHLSETGLTTVGLEVLLGWSGLARLVVLDVSGNRALRGREDRLRQACAGRCRLHV